MCTIAEIHEWKGVSIPIFTGENWEHFVILFPIPYICHVRTTFTGSDISSEMKGGSYIRRKNLKSRGTEQCFF